MGMLKRHIMDVGCRRKEAYEFNNSYVGEIHTAVLDIIFNPERNDEFYTKENKEKTIWLLSMLTHFGEGSLFQRSATEKKGFVPVSMRLARMVMGSNTDEIVQKGLDTGALESGGKCEPESSWTGDEVIALRINPELMVGEKQSVSIPLFEEARNIAYQALELEQMFTGREPYIMDAVYNKEMAESYL